MREEIDATKEQAMQQHDETWPPEVERVRCVYCGNLIKKGAIMCISCFEISEEYRNSHLAGNWPGKRMD